MSNQYVLEWSRKSNGFHIQPLEKSLAGNQKCFLDNTSHDYLVLMIGTLEAVSTMADNWRERLKNRRERLRAVVI